MHTLKAYIMWSIDQLSVELDVVDGTEAIIIVRTPVGAISIIGTPTIAGRVLNVDEAHIGGPGAGCLGRKGLHAIARKLMEELDVDQIVAQGGTRTTGLRNGKKPPPFRFPHP